MSNNSTVNESCATTKPREMTVDEYSELVAKWQQTYYAWNTSYINYYKYLK